MTSEDKLRKQLSLFLRIAVSISIGALVLSYLTHSVDLAKVGIVLMILIPFFRVIYMCVFYFFHKDRTLSALAFAVLVIMSLSFLVGQIPV
ncbi:MAG: DUF1634 domain-containing protein [Pseudobdellovibrionaceae bacterium]